MLGGAGRLEWGSLQNFPCYSHVIVIYSHVIPTIYYDIFPCWLVQSLHLDPLGWSSTDSSSVWQPQMVNKSHPWEMDLNVWRKCSNGPCVINNNQGTDKTNQQSSGGKKQRCMMQIGDTWCYLAGWWLEILFAPGLAFFLSNGPPEISDAQHLARSSSWFRLERPRRTRDMGRAWDRTPNTQNEWNTEFKLKSQK